MTSLLSFLKGLFSSGQDEAQAENEDAARVEELRLLFKSRYHDFKLLLNANNMALKAMTNMEQALKGTSVFGMAFVRSNVTAASVAVYQLVKYMDALAPGKYAELFDRFREVQERINAVLAPAARDDAGDLVLDLWAIDRYAADQTGSKMAYLGEMKSRLGLPVPPGFVITARAFRTFMAHKDLGQEIARILQANDVENMEQLEGASATIQQLVMRWELPPGLEQAIRDAYAALEVKTGPGARVSVRSSALGEDSAQTSFAGQYRSELNVSAANIIQAYKAVAASKYSVQAMAYRLNRGIPDEDVDMCSGCMAMIDAAAGGVIYTRNPLNIRDDSILINSVWGLAKAVVDGSVDSDQFSYRRGDPPTLERSRTPHKTHEFICDPEEGVLRLELPPDRADAPSIPPETGLELARVAASLEEHFGSPQDIEWSVDQQGRLYLLQCRPLQQLATRDEAAHAEIARKAQEAGHSILAHGGVAASPGVGFGPVFVAERHADALRFPDGAILVTERAYPRWAALLNRARAVVTEQGSLAGHLANVAREFGVPALMGVTGAVAALRDADEVTVDADGLTVYSGRVEELLAAPRIHRNLMEGSPVHTLLSEVMRHIIPLNMLNPDAKEFVPASCRTLHDITRFVHEKSVQEMFSFGSEHHFSERMSRQLYYKVPMQYYVLNLDDGFHELPPEEVRKLKPRRNPEKYAVLEEIDCRPMMAIWDGMIAVPWAGPPALDGKGFMSIMHQASANTNLNLTTQTEYADRNYFMISRYFCSLYSRFGFHFSTIEALVGPRSPENYISFKFKGGAADFERRVRRARFIGEILQEFDFRVRVEEDAMFSRVSGQEEAFMRDRLRVLGYLIIHTRQLDMIMANPAMIARYFATIMADLRKMLGVDAPDSDRRRREDDYVGH